MMSEQPANGTRCLRGERLEAHVEELTRRVNDMATHQDRTDQRITNCEISVASVATRVTVWAAVGVTAATVAVQIVFKLLG